MDINVYMDFYLICKAILLGVILGAAYDVLRIIRRIAKHNIIIISIEDVIFWIISGVIFFLMLYDYNGGTGRFLAYIFLALGMLLYHITFSAPIVKYFSLILLKIKIIVSRVLKYLLKKVKMNKDFENGEDIISDE